MGEGQTQRIRRLREEMFLVTDDTVLDIIEAVLEDRYSHVPNEDKGYIILAIQIDKPCPVLIDEDKAPDGLPWPKPCKGGKA